MPEHVATVLLVEDAKTFARAISSKLTHDIGCEILLAHTMVEAIALLENGSYTFDIAVLDLHLPDAQEGEIVDIVLAKGIPTIVLTATLDDETREKILSKNIVDYIFKRSIEDIYYLSRLINRLLINRSTHVLIVDDSQFFRALLRNILQNQLFIVHEAADGLTALDTIKEYPQIKVALVDYNMPNMDGFELVVNLRKLYPKEELSIIAVSSDASESAVSKFLKYGANDYIKKPFSKEEFICRINNNLEHLELIQAQRDLANKDYLTGLYNRRHLYAAGETIHANAVRGNISFVVAMIDIDFFKKINDVYGHHAGDMVLRHFANTLLKNVRDSDIVSRYGGEEFCLLLTALADEDVMTVLEKMRHSVEESFVLYEKRFQIKYTVSVGACTTLLPSLDEMIKVADEMLYKAKNSGRNRICSDLNQE